MERDSEGFLMPRIEQARCVHCGKCAQVCPVDKTMPKAQTQTFLVQIRHEEVRRCSSSGGAFSALANAALCRGGAVFGCAMADDCYSARHICVETPDELGNLRGSKYIQSEIGNAFAEAKRVLEAGRWVLFSGTPCQIAGLRSYLGKKEYDKLLCVDLLCHGTASPWVWEKYLRELEEQYGAKALTVNFRDKREGWVVFSLACRFANGREYSSPVTQDLFLRGFVADLYLRKSCYRCKCQGEQCASDITLGDFWGVERVVPELADGKGTSLAMVHTAKGSEALHAVASDCIIQAVPMEKALLPKSPYYGPVPENPLRDRALLQMRKHPAHRIIGKYYGTSLMAKIRRKAAKLLRRG
jgi:coenzyme F420-reducing hydrogenase beta subunit